MRGRSLDFARDDTGAVGITEVASGTVPVAPLATYLREKSSFSLVRLGL